MTEERSWTIACSLGSLGLMSCKSRAEDFARRLHTKLKTLGGLAHDENAAVCDKSAAEPGEHNRLVDAAADSACLPHPVQTCLTEDDDLFYDFDLDSPGSPSAGHELLHLNPCDSLCNGGEEIRRKGGGGGVGLSTGNGCLVATSQPVSVMRETELYCPCTEHRDSGVGCRLMDMSGDLSPPTPIAYTPPEEFPADRESAYCSGGEQEPCVLGQGQTNEGLTRALLERFTLHDSEKRGLQYEGFNDVFPEFKDFESEVTQNDAIPIDHERTDDVPIDDGIKVRGETDGISPNEENVFFGNEDCVYSHDKLLHNDDNVHEQCADDVSRKVLDELVSDACSVQHNEDSEVKTVNDVVKCQEETAKDGGSPVSPTWGSLKKIDRFQVRQLVNDDGTAFNNTELEYTTTETAVPVDEVKSDTEPVAKPEVEVTLETETKLEDAAVQSDSGFVDEPTTTIILSVLVDQPTEPSPLSPISAHLLDDRPRHIYRSSSLKTGKTPPGTPGRKKIVRFADVFGLDLEDVRHVFLDDLPQVPQSAYSDLDATLIATASSSNHSQVMSSSSSAAGHSCPRPIPSHHRPAKSLIPMFSQPCSSQRFLDRVREQKVCLESAHVADVGISGSVRVLNLAFHKSVVVRYTLNEWRSFLEVEGSFVPGGSDSISDRFTFNLYGGETLGIGERIVFCIRYQTQSQNFWDNNNGQNYFFQCIADNYQLPPSPLDTWDLFL